MAIISIIVPVYNAEATINKCAQSIQAQAYSNIEIIFVNDGSTDNSASLIDALAKKDDRIKVIHTENKGVSAARNTGLAVASGDYIGFVDADDWIDQGMYRHLISLIEREQADIAICGHYLQSSDMKSTPSIAEQVFPSRKLLGNDEAYAAAQKPYGYRGYLFNKLFKSVFFSQEGYHIRMDKTLHICEDLLCVCQCLTHAQKIIYDPMPLYHYVISDNSATNGQFSLHKATVIDATRKIADMTRKQFPALAEETEMIYMSNIAFIFILAQHAQSGFKLSRIDIKRIRKNLALYIFGKGNATKYKLLIIGLSISQNAAKAIWRLFRKRENHI